MDKPEGGALSSRPRGPGDADQEDLRQALRRSEARYAAILEAALDCIVTISADGRVVEWNKAAEQTFGYSREDVLGRELGELIIPPELRQAHVLGLRRYLVTGKGPVIGRRLQLEAIRRDGARIPVELAISPIAFGDGPHFTAYLRDISNRLAAEQALQESADRLRATYDHAFVGIAEVDREGRFLRVNHQLSHITGYGRDELLAMSLWDVTHPDDCAGERDLFRGHMAGDPAAYAVEKRYLRKDGRVVWVEVSSSVVRGAGGRPTYGVRVVRDVTDRRRWSEHQQLLMNELNHRVRNTLATVQSMAAQFARASISPRDAYQVFVERLVSLARTHDVLTRGNWEGAELTEVVASALEPFIPPGADAVTFEGDPVWLSARQALAVAMALHELGTNAGKYGALTSHEGRVHISWRIVAGDEPRCELVWTESGGPPVQPPRRKGFGSRLLEQAELGGPVALDFRAEGLVCTLSLRLDALREACGASEPV